MIARRKSSVILLDVEGTTTPISFVYDTLFPYAREHMEQFLSELKDREDVRSDLRILVAENRAEKSSDAPAISADDKPAKVRKYLLWLMDQDRKSPALKSIQGKIWEAGYASGRLKSIVFADVPAAFKRWHNDGRRIAIYSSGSVLAQKLLFRHSQAGDLTKWIAAYFDTVVGAKTEKDSYKKIAQALGVSPEEMLFLSDSPAELDAAASARLEVRLAMRPGNRAVPPQVRHLPVFSFDEL
jgi:enolase-phosphatase E1